MNSHPRLTRSEECSPNAHPTCYFPVFIDSRSLIFVQKPRVQTILSQSVQLLCIFYVEQGSRVQINIVQPAVDSCLPLPALINSYSSVRTF